MEVYIHNAWEHPLSFRERARNRTGLDIELFGIPIFSLSVQPDLGPFGTFFLCVLGFGIEINWPTGRKRRGR